MTTASNRYPLSTADGKYIPLDVIRPSSFLRLATSESAGTTPVQIPDTVEILRVRSTVDAIIQFSSSSVVATAVVDGIPKNNTLFLHADEEVFVSPPIGFNWYSIINDLTAGKVVVEYLESWNALTLQSKITRR